ncbi:MAG: hypothetical protein ACE366_28780 [Bradymonadia bacterium]
MRRAVKKAAISLISTFALVCLGGQALAADTETVEDMLEAGGQVDFNFEVDPMLVPPTISPSQVMTVTTTREGDTVKGVVLLVDGRNVPFTMTHSRPLIQDQAPRHIADGGVLGAEAIAQN